MKEFYANQIQTWTIKYNKLVKNQIKVHIKLFGAKYKKVIDLWVYFYDINF